MKPPAPAERDVLRAVLEYLTFRGFRVWRRNVGLTVAHHKGKSRVIRSGIRGQADITGYLKANGRHLECEVKREGKEPTSLQSQWLQQAHEEGCIAFWCDSVPAAEAELKRYGYG